LAVEDVSLVRWLLLKGADFDAKTKDGLTPLNYAHESKETPTIHLLELWADVKKGRVKPNKALREALDLRSHKSQRILDAVAAGADDMTMHDAAGRNALHWAAQENEADLMLLLLERGADTKAKDKAGNTALMLARQKGCTDVEEVLRAWDKQKPVKTSASKAVAAKTPPTTIEAELPAVQPDEQLQTALLSRGRYKIDTIMRAVRGGATDFSFTDQSGRTALHWAAMKDDVEAARIALAGGADANAVSNLEQTALDLAKENGSTEVAALLGAPATAATSKVEPLKKQIQPAQPTHDVYIVCSPLNQYFAEQLETSLKRAGVKVFLDLGEAQNPTELSDSRLMLLVASAPTLRSPATQSAIENAQQLGLSIVAGRIDSNLKSRPAPLESALWVDEKRDQSPENLAAIVAAVQAELDKIADVSTVEAGENWYSVNGVEKLRSKKASEVTLSALRELSHLAPQFLEDVEKQVLAQKGQKVQKRRWLARTKEELYTNPEFHNHSVEIVPGWWLGTNYSNDNKREMLEVARETASKLGIKFDFQLC